MDTGLVMTVLKANDQGKMHKAGMEEKFNAIFAEDSKRYKIYKKSF